MRFESNGTFLDFIIFMSRGSFITFALTLSRWARDLNMIHEKTTVSPRFGFTRLGNDFIFTVFKSSPMHSQNWSAPYFRQTCRPLPPCGDKPPGFFEEQARHTHQRSS
jgi:hypothetical protein